MEHPHGNDKYTALETHSGGKQFVSDLNTRVIEIVRKIYKYRFIRKIHKYTQKRRKIYRT